MSCLCSQAEASWYHPYQVRLPPDKKKPTPAKKGIVEVYQPPGRRTGAANGAVKARVCRTRLVRGGVAGHVVVVGGITVVEAEGGEAGTSMFSTTGNPGFHQPQFSYFIPRKSHDLGPACVQPAALVAAEKVC